jgi:hypothetical protein
MAAPFACFCRGLCSSAAESPGWFRNHWARLITFASGKCAWQPGAHVLARTSSWARLPQVPAGLSPLLAANRDVCIMCDICRQPACPCRLHCCQLAWQLLLWGCRGASQRSVCNALHSGWSKKRSACWVGVEGSLCCGVCLCGTQCAMCMAMAKQQAVNTAVCTGEGPAGRHKWHGVWELLRGLWAAATGAQAAPLAHPFRCVGHGRGGAQQLAPWATLIGPHPAAGPLPPAAKSSRRGARASFGETRDTHAAHAAGAWSIIMLCYMAASTMVPLTRGAPWRGGGACTRCPRRPA